MSPPEVPCPSHEEHGGHDAGHHETLSRTRHGDYSQTTAIDCEEGSLRIVIEGPVGRGQIDVESPDDLAPQLRQLDQLAQAIADARAVPASLLGNDPVGGQ